MELTLTSSLSLFILIAFSTAVFFAAKKSNIPYTVLLVLAGLLLVPLVNLPFIEPFLGFLDDQVLTPELLFFIFLPVLIFESSFNISMRRMLESAWAISVLSIVSLIISATVIAALLYYALPLVGVQMPFIVALIFGSLISATDPTAVLSMFKEFGVPRRLGIIFESETLMNDGTAMALFLVVIGIAVSGFHGAETIIHGVTEFFVMIVGGGIFGLAFAALMTAVLKKTKTNDFVTITLILISAHLVFILCEVINHSGIIHVSSIIATSVAALFLGNYSRNILAPQVDRYLDKLMEHVTFVVNSLVFLMAGLLFASATENFADLAVPVLVTVLIVAFARVVSVFAVIPALNMTKVEARIPTSWSWLLSWGSLRGALSIIIVMLIPENLVVEGWTLPYTVREFLLALTIGCILTTLFIKAPVIRPLMHLLNINGDEPLKIAYEADLGVFCILDEGKQLDAYFSKGFITRNQYDKLAAQLEIRLNETERYRQSLVEKHGVMIFNQSLHLAMVNLEMQVLRRLYMNHEICERVYRRLYSKLTLQKDKIEQAQHDSIDEKVYSDRKDIFERLVNFIQMPFERGGKELTLEQKLEYYRAEMIMARKAVKYIHGMQTEHSRPVFLQESYEAICERYTTYKTTCAARIDAMMKEHADNLEPHMYALSERSLSASGERAIKFLHARGLINPHTEHSLLDHYSLFTGNAHRKATA